MTKETIRLISLISLCFLFIAVSQAARAEYGRELNVTLFQDGWAHVEITERLSGQEKSLTLPLPTDNYEYLMVINEDNIMLNYTVVDKSVLIEPENSSRITAIFQTPALTSKTGAIWNFSIRYDADITYVTLPPGSVMIGVSETPDRVIKKGDSLVLTFSKGTIWLSYMMPVQQTSPSQPGKSAQEGRTGTEGKTGIALTFNPLYLIIPVVVAVAAFLLYQKGRKRGSEELDPDERAILNELMRRGGSMYQSELVKVLGLPKTTVWRKINRLSEKGVIRIEKGEKGNIIHLK